MILLKKGVIKMTAQTEKVLSESIKRALQENESVLWQGQAFAFPLLNAENKKRNYIQWGITAALVLAICLATLVLTAEPMWMIAAVVFVIGAFIILLPISERWCVLGADYVITNQRVMVLTGSRVNASLTNDEINQVELVKEIDGGVTLLINEAVSLDARNRRKKGDDGLQDKEENTVGLILYNLDAAECDKAVAALENSPLLFSGSTLEGTAAALSQQLA